MNMIKKLLALLLLGLTLGGATRGEDGAALGDWGHFLSLTPTVHFNNPEGKPFTITVHVMRWAKPDWNPNELTLRLVGPDGGIVVDTVIKLDSFIVNTSSSSRSSNDSLSYKRYLKQ